MKENSSATANAAPTSRITRSRAAALRGNGKVLPLKQETMKLDKKQSIRGSSKRVASKETSSLAVAAPMKKRAVLKDVTNICRQSSFKDCLVTAKDKSKLSRLNAHKANLCTSSKYRKPAPPVSSQSAMVSDDMKSSMAEGITDMHILESQDSARANIGSKMAEGMHEMHILDSQDAAMLMKHDETQIGLDNAEDEDKNFKDTGGSAKSGIIDIDSDHRNPQMCTSYAADIHQSQCATELMHRPSSNHKDDLQPDINQRMRGVLIDWLVEVAEEYRLVPDTLYLSVSMIDRFLSGNHVEKQRLQLLGVSSMLIASKYEEICAPRVEEFCFITDNTYTKDEVIQMEEEVLNYLHFQICIPTIKTFLRRFLRAAQACYKPPIQSLGHLANYLAELTLIEYSFLEFLPSGIAASAVFLARWTLNQSDDPWNPTLQHYTSYKASELKTTVFAMQELQMNKRNNELNAVREKYKQEKYEGVAALTSPDLLQSLFS